MKLEKVIGVFRGYKAALAEKYPTLPPKQLDATQYESRHVGRGSILQHVQWMCVEAEAMYAKASAGDASAEGKLNRWLGYVQGELRGMTQYSVDDLRNHSRSGGAAVTDPNWSPPDGDEQKG